MKLRKDKLLYNRNLKAGIIFSLLLMIAAFYFSPVIEQDYQIIKQHEFAVSFSDIPATWQEASARSAPPKPVLPTIFLPQSELAVLQDIDISPNGNNSGNGTATGLSNGSPMGSSANGDSQISSGTSIPRQILEVFPERTKNKHTGQVKLSLKIGSDGKVVSHKILQNTTGSEECLANSIKAAYKSKWSPVDDGMIASDYWIEKKYEFK